MKYNKKTYKKNNKKRYNKKRHTLRKKRSQKKYNKKNKRSTKRSIKRQNYKQNGGFVTPFIPEGKNLLRYFPYKFSETNNTFNPPNVPGPSNVKGPINPHPAYDQYLRGNGNMIDPESAMGPKLPQIFDVSIKNTQPI